MRAILIPFFVLLAAACEPGTTDIPSDGGLGRHEYCRQCLQSRTGWSVSCDSESTSNPCPPACVARCVPSTIRYPTTLVERISCDGERCTCDDDSYSIGCWQPD